MNEKPQATLTLSGIMAHTGKTTKALAQETGLAYNTVLSYRRDNPSNLSKVTLETLAECLGVEVWELFYTGEFARPLVKIAQALGLPQPGAPIIGKEYKALLIEIGKKAGVEITESDFEPLPQATNAEWV